MKSTRSTLWRRLATPEPSAGAFDPAGSDGLPAPARRFLGHALHPGVPLARTVVLDMTGALRLGARWMPFRAHQVVAAGTGFVWAPRVGRLPLVFTGADSHADGRGTLDFRLWGVLPVARQSGSDIDRSSAGRLAAETVVWLPQALTPAMGATWTPVDDDRATVSVPVGDDAIDVTVVVDARGHLRELEMRRWGDPGGQEFNLYPFGGDVDGERTFEGVTIASSGQVGWWWGTPRSADGVYFRYAITRADFRVARTEAKVTPRR